MAETLSELDLKATANLRRHGRIVQVGTAGAWDLGFTPSSPSSWPDSPETIWEGLDQLRGDVNAIDITPHPAMPPARRGDSGRRAFPLPGPQGNPGAPSLSSLMPVRRGENGGRAPTIPGLPGSPGRDGVTMPLRHGVDGRRAPIIPGANGSPGRDGLSLIGRRGADAPRPVMKSSESAGGELAGLYPYPTLALSIRPSRELRYTFDSSTAAADPGSGKIRLNNATLSSVTAAYVCDTDVAGNSGYDVIAGWGAVSGSTNSLGVVTFYKRSDPASFASYTLTAFLHTTYHELALTYITSHGSLATTAGDLGVEYVPVPRRPPQGTFAAHKNGSDQTGIAASTFVKVTATTESFDVGSYYDAANSKWTPPAGKVRVHGKIAITGGVVAAAILAISMYKNGSVVKNHLTYAVSTGGSFETLETDFQDDANGTDYYEMYVYAEGAGNKTVTGDITYTLFEGTTLS